MIVSHSVCEKMVSEKRDINTGKREKIQSDQYNIINQVIIREKEVKIVPKKV